jgi:hypothetical protein
MKRIVLFAFAALLTLATAGAAFADPPQGNGGPQGGGPGNSGQGDKHTQGQGNGAGVP